MKKLVGLIVVLMVNAFVAETVFAADSNDSNDSTRNGGAYKYTALRERMIRSQSAGLAGDTNISDANIADDAPKIEKAFRKELYEWEQIRGEGESRTDLAKAVQGRVEDELNILRQIAVEEKAARTVAAIDKLIEKNKEQLEEITKKLEKKRGKRLPRQADSAGGTLRGRGRYGTGTREPSSEKITGGQDDIAGY